MPRAGLRAQLRGLEIVHASKRGRRALPESSPSIAKALHTSAAHPDIDRAERLIRFISESYREVTAG
jgi:hypothetical protein